jgi:hypothetical protein
MVTSNPSGDSNPPPGGRPRPPFLTPPPGPPPGSTYYPRPQPGDLYMSEEDAEYLRQRDLHIEDPEAYQREVEQE